MVEFVSVCGKCVNCMHLLIRSWGESLNLFLISGDFIYFAVIYKELKSKDIILK